MNSIETDDQGASIHAKPCVICRKRKVKCDKTRPCSNCVRTKQTCTYESTDGRGDSGIADSTALQSSDNDLRERLARLEKLMVTKMVAENATGRSSQASPEIANQTHSRSARSSISPIPPNIPSRSFEPHISSSQVATSDISSGQLVFQEGYSAYFDPDFWPSVIGEVSPVTSGEATPDKPRSRISGGYLMLLSLKISLHDMLPSQLWAYPLLCQGQTWPWYTPQSRSPTCSASTSLSA